MALCTTAQVLQHLGQTASTVSDPAITYSAVTPSGSSTVSQVAVAISSNVLTITPTVTAGPAISASTFTLTNTSYDTMAELVAAMDALPYLAAKLAAADGTTPSTYLDADIGTITAAGALATMTYTDTANSATANFIASLILEVQALAERYCGREFDSAVRDETYDSDGGEIIAVKSNPITTLTGVSLVSYDGTETDLTETTDYAVDMTNGLLYSRMSGADPMDRFFGGGLGDGPAYYRTPTQFRWPPGTQNIRVQYTGGYTTIPYDLRLAAILCVCDLFLDRRNNRLLTSSANQGRSMSRSYSGTQDMIAQYFSPWRRSL